MAACSEIGGQMADDNEEPRAESSNGRIERGRKQLSAGGRRYLAQCELVGRSHHELFDFIRKNYPENYGSIDYYIREGTSASSKVREVLIAYLADTWVPISHSWFGDSWHHFALLDTFVETNRRYSGAYADFCGEFRRIFPATPDDNSPPTGEFQLTSKHICIQADKPEVLRWIQRDNDTPEKIVINGFGLHDGDTAFLIGVNSTTSPKRKSITYIVLARPSDALREHGVRLFGFQAGTIKRGSANGAGVAKRTVLVSPSKWDEWEGGAECPEPVKAWLRAERHGILVDLLSDGNEHDEHEF